MFNIRRRPPLIAPPGFTAGVTTPGISSYSSRIIRPPANLRYGRLESSSSKAFPPPHTRDTILYVIFTCGSAVALCRYLKGLGDVIRLLCGSTALWSMQREIERGAKEHSLLT